MPATEHGLSEFMEGLEVTRPEGCSPKELSQAVFMGRNVVREALEGANVPTDRTIALDRPASLSVSPIQLASGWFITDLGRHFWSGSHREHGEDTDPKWGSERPLMLGEDGELYVYTRRYKAGEHPINDYIQNKYIQYSSSGPDDLLILLGYAIRLRSPTFSPEPVPSEE